MKEKLVILIALIFISCSNNKVFVLKDNDSQKYFLSDSIQKVVKKGQITSSPIFVIDGILMDYDNKLDTVLLPLAKKDVYLLTFLNKKTAGVIYGSIGDKGAVLISTKPNPK